MNAPSSASPVYETALLALLRSGAVLREDLDPMQVVWLDLSHPVFLFDVARCDPERMVSAATRAWLLEGVEHVDVCLAGGPRELFESLTRARPARSADVTHGLARVSDGGQIEFDGASQRLVEMLRNTYHEGVSRRHTEAELALAIADALRRGAAQMREVTAFQDRLSSGAPTLTRALLAVMGALFAAKWMLGDTNPAVDFRMGALVPWRTLAEPWRLVSHSFLHLDAQHILFNGMSLYSLGSFYERVLGRARFAVVFTLAAIGGGVVATLFANPVVGASDALWGFLGVSGALAIRPGATLPRAFQPMFRRNVFGNLALQVLVSLMPGVSWQAHLGGGVVGFALALSGALASSDDAKVERAWRVAGAVAMVLCGLCVIAALATGRAWEITATR